MTYLGWLLYGVLLSVLNFISINRTVNRLFDLKTTRHLWLNYLFRFVFTGSGLFIALQNGAGYMIIAFIGILVFRWSLLSPSCRRFYFQVISFARG